MNVIKLIKAHISRNLIVQASNFLGESEHNTAKGFENAWPAILAGILNASNNEDKIVEIWDLIQHKNNDVDLLNHLNTLFDGNSSESSNTSIGAALLNQLYGGKATILNSISSLAGFHKSNSAGKILSIAAPVVLAFLKNKVENSELGMAGLLKWLLGEKENIVEVLPSGWASQMGFTHLLFNKEKIEMNSEEITNNNRNWWLWLVGSIILVGGLWFLVKSCNQKEVADKLSGAYRNVTEVIESVPEEAEDAATYLDETLDSVGQAFKYKWRALGKYITIKLGDNIMGLPKNGVELKLIEWMNNKANPADQNTWFNFDRILFETGSAKLNKVSDEQIKAIATILTALPTVELKIGGFTDNMGDPKTNTILALDRANAVKKAFVDLGIDPKRLTTHGYGPEHPVASNDTEEGREQNRRVAVSVLKK